MDSEALALLSEELPKVFRGDGSEWSAKYEAEADIRERGWSVGPSSRGGVRAVMFGPDWIIAKYHNLTPDEKTATDAYLIGSNRNGPLTLTLNQPVHA